MAKGHASLAAMQWRALVCVTLWWCALHLSGCRKSSEDDGLQSLVPSLPFRFPAPHRLVAIGDLHGDLAATERVLQLAGAIDSTRGWSGGDLVVVQTGDQLDRGPDDREVLDLLERLRKEAERSGGALHVLNGNHEIMNVAGDFRYVNPRSLPAFAEFASGPPAAGRASAFAPGGPYAKQLADRNIVIQVGDTVFVHGGLSLEHVRMGLGPINEAVRRWMSGSLRQLPDTIIGPTSPLWLRMLSEGTPTSSDCAALADVLRELGARRIVVGHTVQPEGINAACDGRVWRIDAGLSRVYASHRRQALEIEGDRTAVLSEAEDLPAEGR